MNGLLDEIDAGPGVCEYCHEPAVVFEDVHGKAVCEECWNEMGEMPREEC